jgi:hypothetical protein
MKNYRRPLVTYHFDILREEQKEFNLEALMRRMVVDYMTHKIAWIITKIWDNAWASEDMYYIGADEIGTRYEKVLEFFAMDPVERLQKFGPIVMPRAKVDVRGQITMRNGRHRYAVMRDLGAEKIPFSMTEDSLQNAERFGLI